MTILVTGATGQLGRLVIDRLLARGAAAGDLVAGARTPAKAADLAARGVRVVPLDYEDPATVAAALTGVDRVLLISSSEVGKRATQHRVVLDAVSAAGVELLGYTSLTRADTSPSPLAPEHLETERAIAASGIPAVVLRNNWYAENYLPDLQRAGTTGEIAAGAGDGKVAVAARVDYADAAAAVLLGDGHAGRTYELGGDAVLDYDDIAAAIGEVLGREVRYRRLTAEEQRAELAAAGLDEGLAGFVVGLDSSIAAGALDLADPTLTTLIGRPTTTLAEALRAAAG